MSARKKKEDRNLFNLLAAISFKMNNIEDSLAKETGTWIDDKIGNTNRLLNGNVQQLTLNYPEFFWLPKPLKSLLAHLIPLFFSQANNNQLPKTLIENLNRLQQKLSQNQPAPEARGQKEKLVLS